MEIIKRLKLPKIKLWYVLIVLSYIGMTVLYMGPSTWDCKNTLYGFGDNTAGPVWRFGLEPPQAPLGSYSNATNFPNGEQLYTPTNYSLSGQSYAIWGASKILGPVCGYNVFNIVGFVLSATVMFGFVYTITRRRWIAWLAGYAVAFTPYYQMKVGGHPGYGYQALLIGVMWALFNLVTKKRNKDILIFAGLFAFCFYFDPYFSILALTAVGAILAGYLVWLLVSKKKFKKEIQHVFKRFLIASVVFTILISPLLAVTLKNSKTISSSVAATRGNVLFEATACSNLPTEYIAPFVLSPIGMRMFGAEEYKKDVTNLHNDFTCGIGEDTVGLSITIFVVTALGLIIIAWEKLNKRKFDLPLHYNSTFLIISMLLVIMLAFSLALPPVRMFGFAPTPSYILLHLTSTWRTLSRFYVIINVALVVLFSIILVYANNNIQIVKKYARGLFILLFLAIFIEYLAFRPFTGNHLSTFSYQKDVPPAYTWLEKQSNIHTIAEYPLEKAGGESNAMAYYLSMQVKHKKKLFNGNVPTGSDELYKASLKDISDPQTQAILKSLGIDAVVIHGVSEDIIRNIKGLKIVHVEKQSKFNMLAFTPLVKIDDTVIVTINADPSNIMMRFEKGFVRNTDIIRSAADWEYEALNDSIIKIDSYPGTAKREGNTYSCFAIKMAGTGDISMSRIVSDIDSETVSMPLDSNYTFVKVKAKDKIKLTNDKGFNFRIKDLGCN